jgi:hypothetical protein
VEKIIKDKNSGKELIFSDEWRSLTEMEKKSIIRCIPREKILQKWAEALSENFSCDASEFLNTLFEQMQESFIREVECACNFFFWWNNKSQGIGQHKYDLEEMERAFRGAIKHLKRIFECQTSIPVKREISPVPSPEMFLSCLVRKRTVEGAFAAHNILENLCSAIQFYQEPKMSRGAPGHRKASTALAAEVARSYHQKFLLRPTAYREGDFAKIYGAIMSIVSDGKEDPDHSRALLAAIKSLPKDHYPELIK